MNEPKLNCLAITFQYTFAWPNSHVRTSPKGLQFSNIFFKGLLQVKHSVCAIHSAGVWNGLFECQWLSLSLTYDVWEDPHTLTVLTDTEANRSSRIGKHLFRCFQRQCYSVGWIQWHYSELQSTKFLLATVSYRYVIFDSKGALLDRFNWIKNTSEVKQLKK